ncbi:MAG TPA: GAF domain-containing protein [Candidatus Acidoferrales bacterium]
MSEKIVADLTRVVDELVKAGGSIDLPTLSKLADQIGKSFSVKSDEVGILALTEGEKFIHFLVPEKLKQVGNIPMTSTSALSVRTAREKRPEVINNFSTARHPTVFEAVPLGPQRGDPIQKIMSAPITAENKVIGVIQVSRKGKTMGAAGPDFTPKELAELVKIAGVLARVIKLSSA